MIFIDERLTWACICIEHRESFSHILRASINSASGIESVSEGIGNALSHALISFSSEIPSSL